MEISALNKEGFVFLRNVIPTNLIENTKAHAADFLGVNNAPQDIISAMERLEEVDKDNFYKFCQSMGSITPTLQIALIDKIYSIVQNALPGKLVWLTDSACFFNKLEVKRLQYDWHTEKSYFPNAEEVITLWYPWLHDVNERNGTMQVAPRSHLDVHHATRENVEGGLTQMKLSDGDILKKYGSLPCNLNLGDAILFRLNLAHKTGANLSEVPRTTMIIRYTDKTGKFNSGWLS